MNTSYVDPGHPDPHRAHSATQVHREAKCTCGHSRWQHVSYAFNCEWCACESFVHDKEAEK